MKFFEAVLNTFWQGALFALLAWAALRWLPRINAATRCAVWWAVLAVIVLLPLTRINRPRPVPATAALIEALPAPVFNAPTPRFEHTTPLHRPRFELQPGAWIQAVAAIWFAVFLGQIARLTVSFFYLRRLKRNSSLAPAIQRAHFDELLLSSGVRRPARLLLSARIPSPIAVGFLRPAAILPETLPQHLTPAELDHVLLHEIAHIARRDDWFHLAATFAWSVLALHPVAAWVLRRIEREREIACDDWVVAATGSPRPYAQSLARLFELCTSRRRILLASGIAGTGSQLGDRIALLLERGRAFTAQVSFPRVAISAAVLIVMVAAASRTPSWIAFAHPATPTAFAELEAVEVQPEPPQSAPVPAARPQSAAPSATPVPVAQPVPANPHSFLAGLVAAGYGDLSVDDIVNLKIQGVTGQYLIGMSQAGWGKLPPAQIINLKIQGVSPDYVRQINALGFGPYTPEEIVNFKIQGVPVELLRALKDYGFSQVSANEIIEAKIHGLSAHSLHEARTYGPNLTLRQIVKLKQAGII